MSILALCDLISNCSVWKMYVMRRKSGCNCQKQSTFSPERNQPEGVGLQNNLQNYLENPNSSELFSKLVVKVAAPFIGQAVDAKTKNPQVGLAKIKSLRSINGRKLFSFIEMHSIGSRAKLCNFSWNCLS